MEGRAAKVLGGLGVGAVVLVMAFFECGGVEVVAGKQCSDRANNLSVDDLKRELGAAGVDPLTYAAVTEGFADPEFKRLAQGFYWASCLMGKGWRCAEAGLGPPKSCTSSGGDVVLHAENPFL